MPASGLWGGIDYSRNNIALDTYFSEKLNKVTLAQSTSLGDDVIYLEPGHGVVAGEYIEFFDGLHHMQTEVESVSGDEITLNTPVDNTYTPTTSELQRENISMNVDASTTEREFCFCTYTPMWVQFIGIQGIMTHTGAGDDGLFGDLTALTNGIYIGSERQVTPTYRKTTHLWSGMKRNGDIRIHSTNFAYSSRAPSGEYSTVFGMDFSLRNQSNILLSGVYQDRIFLRIRDNLSGLSSFNIVATANIFQK